MCPLQLLLQMRQALRSHCAAAEAACDGEEIRSIDVDADLRNAAFGHVFLDLPVAAVVPHEDGYGEPELDGGGQLGDRELQAAVADERDDRPLALRQLGAERRGQGI